MAFTGFLENLNLLADVARILAGFGAIAILLAVLKTNSERRCWRKYKRYVRSWLDDMVESGHKLDNAPELWWKTECERRLMDSKFGPMEIDKILNTAVAIAMGIAMEKMLIQPSARRDDDD